MSNDHSTSFNQPQKTGHFFTKTLNTLSIIPFYMRYKQRTYEMMNIQEGHVVLDAGCATGSDVYALSQYVGKTGKAIGIDTDEIVIKQARKQTDGKDLRIQYSIDDVHDMDFEDDTFNSCRCDRTFQSLKDPDKALSELIRVTKPGGHIIVIEPDHDTMIIDNPNIETTRKFVSFRADMAVRNGSIGRRLSGMFKSQKLNKVTVTPETLVLTDYMLADEVFDIKNGIQIAKNAAVITETEARRWLRDLDRADRAGQFFFALTFFIVSGKK